MVNEESRSARNLKTVTLENLRSMSEKIRTLGGLFEHVRKTNIIDSDQGTVGSVRMSKMELEQSSREVKRGKHLYKGDHFKDMAQIIPQSKLAINLMPQDELFNRFTS
jgi:hypothetical protein